MRLGHFRGSMYAIIETGGKQYRTRAGEVIQIEKLEGEVGSNLQFDKVLFVSSDAGAEGKSDVVVGKPTVASAKVQAEIVGQGRGDKLIVFKMKRRKQYRKLQGHRQFYTQVLITGIDGGSGKSITLSDADKKAKLAKFSTGLKPKGQAFTPKTLGSRKKMKASGAPATAKQAAPAGETATKKAAPAKKAPAKKAAPKKK